MSGGLFCDLPVQLAPPRAVNPLRGPLPPGANMGHAAVMAGRLEASDSLDFFPTPPWVARALVREALPVVCRGSDWGAGLLERCSWWEPACGAGHMAGPMAGLGLDVFADDVADYGFANPGGPCPRLGSFVDLPGRPALAAPGPVDWVITNPPFNLSAAFVRRALEVARRGIVMVVRLSWLESIERWTLRQGAPLWAAVNFAERVPMFRGRWEPIGASATAYAVMVWLRAGPDGPWSSPEGPGVAPEHALYRGWTMGPGAAERHGQPGDAARWGGWFPRMDGMVLA